MIQDLVAQDADDVEGLPGSNGVDKHVAMDADEVLGVQNAIFVLERRASQADDRRLQQAILGWVDPWLSAYLTRGVDYFRGEVLAFISDDTTEGIFDCRIIAFNKVPVHELHRE